MKKYLIITLSFLAITCNVFATKPSNEYALKQIENYLHQAKELVKNSKDKFEEEVYFAFTGLMEGIDYSLQNQSDWKQIFHVAVQMGIALSSDIPLRLDIFRSREEDVIKHDKKLTEKIYHHLAECYKFCEDSPRLNPFVYSGNPSGDENDNDYADDENDNDYEFSTHRKYFLLFDSFTAEKIFHDNVYKLFTNINSEEMDDRFYETYRKFLMLKAKNLAASALELKYEAELIYEKAPNFASKDLIRIVVASIFQSSLVRNLNTKMVLVASNLIYEVVDKCFESYHYNDKHLKEYTEKLYLAKSNMVLHDNIMRWVWTH